MCLPHSSKNLRQRVRIVAIIEGLLGHGAMRKSDGLLQIIAIVRESALIKASGLFGGDGVWAIAFKLAIDRRTHDRDLAYILRYGSSFKAIRLCSRSSTMQAVVEVSQLR